MEKKIMLEIYFEVNYLKSLISSFVLDYQFETDKIDLLRLKNLYLQVVKLQAKIDLLREKNEEDC
jgi:hypothetical protein